MAGKMHNVSDLALFILISSILFVKVDELIYELDPNHSGQITHEEFVLIMKYIEQKQAQLPPIGQTFQNESHASGNLSATHS